MLYVVRLDPLCGYDVYVCVLLFKAYDRIFEKLFPNEHIYQKQHLIWGYKRDLHLTAGLRP